MIDIKGLDKAVVLAALYNASKPQGLGFLNYSPDEMKVEEARMLLRDGSYFDYLRGRVIKVDLDGDELDEWLYDRDNGAGTALAAINQVRSSEVKMKIKFQGLIDINEVKL